MYNARLLDILHMVYQYNISNTKMLHAQGLIYKGVAKLEASIVGT